MKKNAGRTDKKKYLIVYFVLLVAYGLIFTLSVFDGRFVESVGGEEVLATSMLTGALIFAPLLIGLLSLVAFIFYKLRWWIQYLVFALPSLYVILLAPINFDSCGGFICFPWYIFLEIATGLLMLIWFGIVMLVSGLIVFAKRHSKQ